KKLVSVYIVLILCMNVATPFTIAACLIGQNLRFCAPAAQKTLFGGLRPIHPLKPLPAKLFVSHLGGPAQCLAVGAVLQASTPSPLWPSTGQLSAALSQYLVRSLDAAGLSGSSPPPLWPSLSPGQHRAQAPSLLGPLFSCLR